MPNAPTVPRKVLHIWLSPEDVAWLDRRAEQLGERRSVAARLLFREMREADEQREVEATA